MPSLCFPLETDLSHMVIPGELQQFIQLGKHGKLINNTNWLVRVCQIFFKFVIFFLTNNNLIIISE
jgi:hypothetical protein